MSKRTPVFKFEHVSFAWPGGRSVLEKQSFSLPKGGFVLVRGPSGSGKSTLLRLMNRFESAQAGCIRYAGIPLADWNPSRLRRQVVYLQQAPVIRGVSVRETLLQPFGFSVNKDKSPPDDGKIREFLDRLKLDKVDPDDSGAALSGGQRQRLAFLRALFLEPEVLLLDEPAASLDRESRTIVEELAEAHCRQGHTVIMVTHDDFQPGTVPGITLTIDNGKVAV